MVKVYNSGNTFVAQQVVAALGDNGICVVKKDAGAGSFITITVGASLAGVDIYVKESDVKRAKEIIRRISGEKAARISREEEPGLKKLAVKRRILAIVTLFFFLLFGAVNIVMSIL